MTFTRGMALALALSFTGCGGDGGGNVVERLAPSYTLTEPSLLVAVGGAGTMRVLKQSDLSITATVTLRGRLLPHQLNLSADKSSLAVSELSPLALGMDVPPPGELLILDPKTGAEKASVFTPGGTENAILLANGRIAWPERATGMLHFGKLPVAPSFDIAPEADVAACLTPMQATLTANSAFILVGCQDADTISIVDATTRIKTEVAVGDGPLAAWVGAGTTYFVANQTSKDLSVGGIGQTPVPFALGYAPGMVAPNPSGTEIAVADRDAGRVVIYRISTMTPPIELVNVGTGAGTFAIVWAPDGKKLWVTNETAGTVVSVLHPDAVTLTVDKTQDVGPGAYGLVAISP